MKTVPLFIHWGWVLVSNLVVLVFLFYSFEVSCRFSFPSWGHIARNTPLKKKYNPKMSAHRSEETTFSRKSKQVLSLSPK